MQVLQRNVELNNSAASLCIAYNTARRCVRVRHEDHNFIEVVDRCDPPLRPSNFNWRSMYNWYGSADLRASRNWTLIFDVRYKPYEPRDLYLTHFHLYLKCEICILK